MKHTEGASQKIILGLFLLASVFLFLQGIIVEGGDVVKNRDGLNTVKELALAGMERQLELAWKGVCFPVMDFREIPSQKEKILL